MKTIQVSKTVWKKLKKIKKERGYRVFNQVIKDLVERVDRVEDETPGGDLEKDAHTFKKLKNDQARADYVHAAEELQHAITNRIHAQDSYKNTMKEMARTEKIFRKEMDDFCSELDETTRAINNSKLRKNAYSAQPRTQP